MAQLPTVEEEVFFVRSFIPIVDEELTKPNTNTFGIHDVSKGKHVQAPELSLNIGDTLQIIEVSPDKRWCKAIITTRFSNTSDRRTIYGLSAFGSNAITIKEKHNNTAMKRRTKESPPNSPPKHSPPQSSPPPSSPETKPASTHEETAPEIQKPPNSSRWLSVAPREGLNPRASHGENLSASVSLRTAKVDKALLRTNTTPDIKKVKGELSLAPKPGESKGLRPNNSSERDGSFRTIAISKLQCTSQVCEIIGSKLKHTSQIASEFCLWEVSPNGEERLLSKDEKPADVVKSWKNKEEKKLVFTINQQSAEKLGQSRRLTGPVKHEEEDDGLEVLLDSLANLATKRDTEAIGKANGNLTPNELEGLLAELVSTAAEWNAQNEE